MDDFQNLSDVHLRFDLILCKVLRKLKERKINFYSKIFIVNEVILHALKKISFNHKIKVLGVIGS